MANSEIRWLPLGEFIEPYNVRCGNPNAVVSGVNISKEFIRSHANLETTDISGYYSVPPKHFACNLMHIGRDERIPIAYNDTGKELVVTSAYSVFRIKDEKRQEILEEYLFLYFNSKEIDRLCWFYTDGSVRGNLQEKRLLGMQIPVPFIGGKPSVKRQQEIVDSWRGIKKMKQQNAELTEPLFQLCRSYLENLKSSFPPVEIGQFIEQTDERNTNGVYTLDNLRGLSIQKIFTDSKANMDGVSLLPYKVVHPSEFCFVTITSRNSDKITLALNKSQEDYIVSSSYVTFKIIDKEKLDPYFLYLWFCRPEFDRYARFHSIGSAREAFDYTEMEMVKIPLPDINTQRAIVNIYHCAEECRRIAAEADALSQTISPALMQHVIHEHN